MVRDAAWRLQRTNLGSPPRTLWVLGSRSSAHHAGEFRWRCLFGDPHFSSLLPLFFALSLSSLVLFPFYRWIFLEFALVACSDRLDWRDSRLVTDLSFAGNTYSIRNVGSGTARVFFAQAREMEAQQAAEE